MTSPLQKYLQDRETTPGAFALAAGVSRALVQAVAAGDMPLRGRLRDYLNQRSPDLIVAQEAYRETLRKEIERKLEAA